MNDPNSGDVDAYVFSGKLFAGYRYSDAVRFEVAYHHLGRVPYAEYVRNPCCNTINGTVRSYAGSGSVIYAFPPLPPWLGPASLPARIFVRGGLAYKNILQEAGGANFEEGTLSAVIGTGVEFELGPRWFGRLEVEHLSVAIGGPVHTAPLLRGLFSVNIGGTSHVPNVMHTQIMFSLGHKI